MFSLSHSVPEFWCVTCPCTFSTIRNYCFCCLERTEIESKCGKYFSHLDKNKHAEITDSSPNTWNRPIHCLSMRMAIKSYDFYCFSRFTLNINAPTESRIRFPGKLWSLFFNWSKHLHFNNWEKISSKNV